jgi:diketogulonate reductase-like aldo/keto reductase
MPLRGGTQIPQLGYGVFQVPPKETVEAVTRALATGYRHIDTAAAYGNEAQVGEAISASGLERGEVFVTTKCPNEDHGYEEAKRALHGSLGRLGFDYVDLYLIHWPVPLHDRYVETWRAFIDMRDEGLARSIGVSNFLPAHLQRVISETGETPAINQVELHPYFQQRELRSEHERLGIVTEAYSPLAQGLALHDPVIVAIAERHSRTTGQIVIRWHLQIGNVVIPKSVTAERIRQNFEVFDFELSDDEIEAIDGLDAGRRIGGDPETFVHP